MRQSGVAHALFVQPLLERGGVAEAFGACEPVEGFGDDEVRFERAEAVVTVRDGVGDQAGDCPWPSPAGTFLWSVVS